VEIFVLFPQLLAFVLRAIFKADLQERVIPNFGGTQYPASFWNVGMNHISSQYEVKENFFDL